MKRVFLSLGAPTLRSMLVAASAVSLGACANEPVVGASAFAPIMMAGAKTAQATEIRAVAPADPIHELSRKSLAAKVLASRALENVTGLKTDPARLSEHD